MKKGLKGTMPALVNRRVGSPAGIREALGMGRCPLLSKNWAKELLIWSPSMSYALPVQGYGLRMPGGNCMSLA
jgi:hypothetical protein